MNFGECDALSPIEEVRRGVERIADRYDRVGAPENFQCFIQQETGHAFTEEMRRLTWQWFATHLKHGSSC